VEGLEMIPGVCAKLKNHCYYLYDLQTYKGYVSFGGEIMSLAFIKKNKMAAEYQT